MLTLAWPRKGENCRAHRRKCVLTDGDRCERCIRTNAPCVFIVTSKPKIVTKKTITYSKKRRLLNQVRNLEEICENLETQLQSMDIHVEANSVNSTSSYNSFSREMSTEAVNSLHPETSRYTASTALIPLIAANTCNCSYPTPCSHVATTSGGENKSDWNLAISREQQGLRFQTSIKSIEDVIIFTAESLKYFSIASDVPRHPLYYSEKRDGQLEVTLRKLDSEELVAQLIKRTNQKPAPQNLAVVKPLLQKAYYSAITQKLLKSYFKCFNLTYALVHEQHFYRHIEDHSDSVLIPAMCSLMMVNQCQHAKLDMVPIAARKDLQIHFATAARTALEDVLFEQQPTLESVAAMMYLGHYNLLTGNGNEAWLQMGTAWQMATELKAEYLPILKSANMYQMDQQLDAETWKRLYYYIRFVVVNLYTIFQPSSNFLNTMDDCDLGTPTMNDHDLQDEDHKNAFIVLDTLIKISIVHLQYSSDNVLYSLFKGSVETVPQASVEKMEHFLYSWWKELPDNFKLGTSPIEYLAQEKFDTCSSAQVIMLSNTYHLFWMAFQCRLMRDPRKANLAGTSLHYSNSDRALAIVSISCDAYAKGAEALYRLAPCKIDMHYLIIALDVMSRLQESADKKISSLAKTNLEVTMRILNCVIREMGDKGVQVLTIPSKTDISAANTDAGLGRFLGLMANVTGNFTPCT